MRKTDSPGVHYIRRNFDQAAILAVAAKLAFERNPDLSESELATVAAMQRAHPQAGDSPEALGEWLARMDEDQIAGVVNNTKGVLHEMEFVRLENEDGDSVHAALFESTSHAGTDVRFSNIETGQSWDIQLKATDSSTYVRGWLETHPDGEIAVTSELAERLGLPDSGFSNAGLTARTEGVVDTLLQAGERSDLWDYFPALSGASISLVIWELWQRRQRGDIRSDQFKWMAARVAGVKTGKIALLTLAMMTPGLNVAVGAALVASLLFSGAQLAKTISR